MVRDNSRTADEAQIRRLIDRWAGAIRDKNIEAAVPHYARDILLFEPVAICDGSTLDEFRDR
jgi:ketosteroid isomerase-like protein